MINAAEKSVKQEVKKDFLYAIWISGYHSNDGIKKTIFLDRNLNPTTKDNRYELFFKFKNYKVMNIVMTDKKTGRNFSVNEKLLSYFMSLPRTEENIEITKKEAVAGNIKAIKKFMVDCLRYL